MKHPRTFLSLTATALLVLFQFAGWLHWAWWWLLAPLWGWYAMGAALVFLAACATVLGGLGVLVSWICCRVSIRLGDAVYAITGTARSPDPAPKPDRQR